MRPVLSGCVCLCYVLVSAACVHAQVFGRPKPASRGATPQQVDCAAIAAMPGSVMDQASCEAMNKAAAAYNDARSDPAGARPGDETETCEQIKAELMSQPIAPPDAGHAAAGQAASKDLQAKMAAMEAETAAAEAKLSAEAAAASAAGMVNPIAGRAADAAMQASAQATEATLNAHARATVQPAMRQTLSSTATLVGDMTPQLASNPRLAHLIAMSQAKRCRGF